MIAKLVNLTPHDVNIYREEDLDEYHRVKFGCRPYCVIPPATQPTARIITQERPVDPLNVDGMDIPLTAKAMSHIQNLPAPADGTFYIVSTIVAFYVPHRSDLLVPTGNVRSRNGVIVGCTGFSRMV